VNARAPNLLSKGAMVVFVLAVTIACDPTIRVEGTVHDRQGNPLEGVTVTLQSEGRGPHKTATAKDGSFGIGIVGADPRQTRLSFEKEGYKTVDLPLGGNDRASLQVTLEREVPKVGPASEKGIHP